MKPKLKIKRNTNKLEALFEANVNSGKTKALIEIGPINIAWNDKDKLIECLEKVLRDYEI